VGSPPSELIKVGSNPDEDTIILHPRFFQPKEGGSTATQEALRAHELFHVWQRAETPDFDHLFKAEAKRNQLRGGEPWDNIFEKQAYAFEIAVKKDLIQRGFPERVH